MTEIADITPRASQKCLYDRKFTHLSGTIARYESLVLDAKIQQQNTPISVRQIEKRKELDKRSKKWRRMDLLKYGQSFRQIYN